jgi:hypothetical protein
VDSAIIVYKRSPENQRVRLFEYTDGFQFVKEADCEFFLRHRDYIINIEAFKAGGIAELMQKIENASKTLSQIAEVKAGLKRRYTDYSDRYIDGKVTRWRDVIQEINRLAVLQQVCFTRKTFFGIPQIRKRIQAIQAHCDSKSIIFKYLTTPARCYNQANQAEWNEFFNSVQFGGLQEAALYPRAHLHR